MTTFNGEKKVNRKEAKEQNIGKHTRKIQIATNARKTIRWNDYNFFLSCPIPFDQTVVIEPKELYIYMLDPVPAFTAHPILIAQTPSRNVFSYFLSLQSSLPSLPPILYAFPNAHVHV